MINKAPPASNSFYGREKVFWYDKINFSNHVCHCSAVVKELLARADKPGSTPGNAFFCFFVPFFFLYFCLVSFFNTIFPFGLFFLSSCCWPCWSCTSINIFFKLKSGVIFWKREFRKLLICILAKHTTRKNNNNNNNNNTRAVKTCPSSETAEFFSVLADIMTNNTLCTTNRTNLHPTPTSDPLTKVKLAFCTSS